MQVGTSQLATVTQDSALKPLEKRKSRHKLKGKTREAKDVTVLASTNSISKAAQNQDSFADDDSTWCWASLTESSVSSYPPVFTGDCRYFFSIVGASVKIYATATGKVVSTLSSTTSGAPSTSRHADGHTSDITAAVIDPRNGFQLITASLDGRIKVWDFLEASLLRTIEIGEPITHMCAHESLRDHVIVATSSNKKHKKENAGHSKLFRVSLLPSKGTVHLAVHKPRQVLKVGKIKSTTGLTISPSGTWLVATGGYKVYVCPTATLGSGLTKFVSNEILTCLAFHPTEEYFATGDLKGQIRLWYCLDEAQMSAQSRVEKRAQTTTLHWHAHAVSSIAFTPNGSYLLSGGEEAVLVIWQLHTGKREYVPRVGAPIRSVAVASHKAAEEEYLLILTDGTLVFIGAGTLRITRSIARIKLDPNFWSSGPAPLAVHTQTSTLILPSSHPSSLLIYSPLTNTLLAELEVSPSNRVSRRDEEQIEPSRVDSVAVSDSGEWLATIDRREGGEDFERETHMKIWQWDSSTSTWNLNSRIDRPHGVHNVNALMFTPMGNQMFLVSIGDDLNVKVWRTKVVSNKRGEDEVFWVCRSTLGYRGHIPVDAVCSPDGSLLVVAFGPHAVVFELLNNVIRLDLTCPEAKDVSHLAFVGSSGRDLVVTGRRDLVLWDLVTSSVRWHHSSDQSIRHIVAHPKNNSFAVMYRGHNPHPTLIQTFNASSATPVSSHTLPFSLRRVAWYPYISSIDDYTFVGITQSWNTVVFGDRVQVPEEEGHSAKGILADADSHRRNLFEDIFGASAFRDFRIQAPRSAVPAVQDVISDTVKLDGPLNVAAYLLPPLHTLFAPLMEQLLQPRSIQPQVDTKGQEQAQEEDVEDEDVVMASAQTTNPGTGRTVREGEMDEFVELFKQRTFSSGQGNLTTVGHHSNGNGIARSVNGTHGRKALTMSAVAPPNGKNYPPKVPPEIVERISDTIPTIVGKKRKKAMV